MCEHTVSKSFPKDNELFDNGGWKQEIPKPKGPEELLAPKKNKEQQQKKE
jgi:hypothetical protein